MRCNFFLLLGCLAGLGGTTAAAGAAPADAWMGAGDSGLSLRGFGTLGLARSSSDQVEFVRDLSQPRGISNHGSGRIDSILGVQGSWQAAQTFELTGQVVSRYHVGESRKAEVMWAFAKWEPDPALALRLGRLGADFLMAADSRLVGFSYLPVRPSVDFFGPLFFSYFDGGDASLTLPAGGGLLRAKAYAGRTREKSSVADHTWDVDNSALNGLVLDYFKGSWQLRASTAQLRLASDLPFAGLPSGLRTAGAALGIPAASAAADAIAVGGTTSRFHSLGAVYDDGPVQVQGMANVIDHETSAFQNSRAGYLLAGYRLAISNLALTPFVGISRWTSKVRNISTGLPNVGALIALNQGFERVMRDSGADQTTYTLGVRWDLRANVALKAQWDGERGTPRSLFPYRGDQPGWSGRTDVLSLALDFVF
jgi:hypothetical protein